jgi:hypothetical protein
VKAAYMTDPLLELAVAEHVLRAGPTAEKEPTDPELVLSLMLGFTKVLHIRTMLQSELQVRAEYLLLAVFWKVEDDRMLLQKSPW